MLSVRASGNVWRLDTCAVLVRVRSGRSPRRAVDSVASVASRVLQTLWIMIWIMTARAIRSMLVHPMLCAQLQCNVRIRLTLSRKFPIESRFATQFRLLGHFSH
jgi:hypothetical protein